jgi:APA family basic amino acid/polyamine antiporter
VTAAGPAGAETVLRRALGLRTVVSTSTGLAFAALEYLAAAGLVVYVAGDSAWIAVGTAGLLALLAWGCFSELNGLFPTAAAIRLYMKRAMDDRLALTITFTYLTTIVLVVAADAFIVGSAIAHVIGQSTWVAAPIIALLLAAAVASNLRGVKVAGGVQDVATYSVLAVTTLVAVTALVRSHRALRFPLSPLHGHHPGDFLEAVALGVFLFSAFEWVTTSAEEVRRPRDIHRGMLIALGLLVLVCGLISVAMSHVLDHRQLVSAYPQLFLGHAAFGPAGLWLMAVLTAATAVNTFNGGFITASRFIYATAREGSLPPALAKLNDRAVPWVPVVALGTASLLVSLLVAATGSWSVLVAVGAALEAMIYAVAAFCVVRLRTRLPGLDRPFRLPAPRLLGVLAMAVFGVLAAVASVSVANHFDLLPLVVIALATAASALYVLVGLPRVRAAEEARRLARGRRRPPRRPPTAPDTPGPAVPDGSGPTVPDAPVL